MDPNNWGGGVAVLFPGDQQSLEGLPGLPPPPRSSLAAFSLGSACSSLGNRHLIKGSKRPLQLLATCNPSLHVA